MKAKNKNSTILLLGLAPALALSVTVGNAIRMSFVVTLTLIGSNLIISLLRGIIPRKGRLVCYAAIITSITTIIDMIIYAFFPIMATPFGIYVPLVAVNCIVLIRAENYASQNKPHHALWDAITIGAVYTALLVLINAIREFFTLGSIFNLRIVPEGSLRLTIMEMPIGAFFMLGLVVAIMQYISRRRRRSLWRDEEALV